MNRLGWMSLMTMDKAGSLNVARERSMRLCTCIKKISERYEEIWEEGENRGGGRKSWERRARLAQHFIYRRPSHAAGLASYTCILLLSDYSTFSTSLPTTNGLRAEYVLPAHTGAQYLSLSVIHIYKGDQVALYSENESGDK